MINNLNYEENEEFLQNHENDRSGQSGRKIKQYVRKKRICKVQNVASGCLAGGNMPVHF